MSYLEAGRSLCTETSNSMRFEINLFESNDDFFNTVNYRKLVDEKQGNDVSKISELQIDNSVDFFNDYEEESFIDDSEFFPDSYPAGKQPESGGFFINTGKLKLKSILPVEKMAKINLNEKLGQVSMKNKKTQKKERKEKKSKTNELKKNIKIKIPSDKLGKMNANAKLDSILATLLKKRKNDFYRNKPVDPSIRIPTVALPTEAQPATRSLFHHYSNHCSNTAKTPISLPTTPVNEGLVNSMKNYPTLSTHLERIHSVKYTNARSSFQNVSPIHPAKVTFPKEKFLSARNDSCQALNLTKKSETNISKAKHLPVLRKGDSRELSKSSVSSNSTLATILKEGFAKISSNYHSRMSSNNSKSENINLIGSSKMLNRPVENRVNNSVFRRSSSSASKSISPMENFHLTKSGSFKKNPSPKLHSKKVSGEIHSFKDNKSHSLIKNNLLSRFPIPVTSSHTTQSDLSHTFSNRAMPVNLHKINISPVMRPKVMDNKVLEK
ncbi:uncharacterized protein NPIL_168851 [Nephila pilipes]|uniref:Uncharacterized protein n=1 Tax=Nephila pilipes TaxID=299642 RepID=A0A8X6Q2P1_NEPPI|nr:uncharacterized protein NPIL_168851 [Nephila pilipes]